MDIRTIRIIICISDSSEMVKDGRQIKALANELNNRSENVCIITETVKADMAEEYISRLSDCDLVFVLFYDSVSESQREYFDKAVESYKVNAKPLVIPYIKYIDDIDDVTDEIATLQQHIGENLHHYYKSYNSSDALKLAVMLQLSEAGYLSLDLNVRNGKISYGGEEDIDTANIPMFANNANLDSLKSGLAKLDKTLVGYFEDPTPEKREKYKNILAKRSDIIARITDAEKDLMVKMREFVSNTSKGNLDNDQIMAYRFMENGDVELALELLDSAVICEDLKITEKAVEDAFDRMQKDIDKLCQRIDALEMKTLSEEIVREKQELFEEIRSYILKYPELNSTPLYRYSIFLKQHNNTSLAFKVAKEYYSRVKDGKYSDDALLMLLELSVRMGLSKNAKEYGDSILAKENSHPLRVSEACYHLARIYQDEGEYKKAQEFYEKSAKIENAFLDRDPYRNDKLSAIYQCIATLYNDMSMDNRYGDSKQNIDKALCYCERSVSAARRMIECDDFVGFKAGLAESLQAQGVLYANQTYIEEATELFMESEAILQEISKTDPIAYESKLASLYSNIADLFAVSYFYNGRRHRNYIEQSLRYYEKATQIYQRYIVGGEVRFALQLAKTYEKIGTLHYKDGNIDGAVENYDRQVMIIGSPREEGITNLHMLIGLYERNGRLYAMLKNEEKSMNYHMKALLYCMKITEKDPAYLKNFALSLSVTLDSVIALDTPEAALYMLNEYIEHYCSIAGNGVYLYEDRVAYLYLKLGDTAYKRDSLEDALEYYKKSFAFYEKICREGDVLSIRKPAELGAKIGALLSGELRDSENSIIFYKKSFVYFRMLTEIDFHRHADDYIQVARLTALVNLNISDNEQAVKYFMECVRACKERLISNPIDIQWIYTDCHYRLAMLVLPYDKEMAKRHITIACESCEKMKDTDKPHYNNMFRELRRFYDELFSE